MKKFVATLMSVALFFAGTTAFAQISDLGGTWSAGGGYIGFNLGGTQADKVDLPSLPGFYFGASLDYHFSTIESLSVEPGVYIMHFGKAFRWGQGTEEKSYHANYLSVPINLKYSFTPADSGFGLAVFTGPRINVGGAGNMFSTGKTYPGLKALEAQWGFGLAATIQEAVVLRAGYDKGLTKCIRDNKDIGFDDVKAFRNSFYVGIGFLF